MLHNVPSWKIINKLRTKWLRSQQRPMTQNAPIKEKKNKKTKKMVTSKYNLLPTNNKSQEVDVHSWVDLRKRETLIFSKWAQALMSPSFLNSITICQQTRLISRWSDAKKVNSQSASQGKFSIPIPSICNILYFTMEMTTKKSEDFSAAQDLCPMKN